MIKYLKISIKICFDNIENSHLLKRFMHLTVGQFELVTEINMV